MIEQLSFVRLIRFPLLFVGVGVMLFGCTIRYSFTGASISPDVKSVSISPFPNLAPIVNPTLSASFTEQLKDRFMSQTSLNLVEAGGDLDFSGEIVDYQVVPTAIQGDETAAMNRFSVTIRVQFTNHKDEKASYNRSFSAYEDFSSSQAFQSVEQALVESILEKLVEDIFNAAVANW